MKERVAKWVAALWLVFARVIPRSLELCGDFVLVKATSSCCNTHVYTYIVYIYAIVYSTVLVAYSYNRRVERARADMHNAHQNLSTEDVMIYVSWMSFRYSITASSALECTNTRNRVKR